MRFPAPRSWFLAASLLCLRPAAALDLPPPSAARLWNEEALEAIRIDIPNPPVHARNLLHLSVAMYDAWAVYDPVAAGVLTRTKRTSDQPEIDRHVAVSLAAYAVLTRRYALSHNAEVTLGRLRDRLESLGLSTNLPPDPDTSAVALGLEVARRVLEFAADDGSREAQAYADLPVGEGGYASVNEPLLITLAGTLASDINRWQPLAITDATSQNGIPVDSIQTFLGARWKWVRPFALPRFDPEQPWPDPGPPPQFDAANPDPFHREILEVLGRSAELTPDDGEWIDLSPGVHGNNSLGADDGTGHPLNPATGTPYTPNPVRRGDYGRVIAEYWADGPHSETPPGHWNTLANAVADHPQRPRRIGGTGPEVDALEWDVKLYLALNGALHDAACAAWSLKRHYDGWRPISAIRFLGQRGQSSDPDAPLYSPRGLPLVPGLIEQVTLETARRGGRHQGWTPGLVVLRAWAGQPADPVTQHGGVAWMQPRAWFPYQASTFITPSFPGYVSGHSAFSRAAAEVLAAFTGDPFFPGGIAGYSARAGTFLRFEHGPQNDVDLQWATYFDAADEAGRSRIWGGIHPPADDHSGRRVGAEAGRRAWALARRYFDGSVASDSRMEPPRAVGSDAHLQADTVRGQTYRIQSAASPLGPWTDLDPGPFTATDQPTRIIRPASRAAEFFRIERVAP